MPDASLFSLQNSPGADLRPWVERGHRALRGLVFIAAILVALFSYRYLFGSALIPSTIASNRHRTLWLVTHAGFAATALLLGALQFNRAIRTSRPRIHRILGRLYVVSCLVGGAAGLVLALGSTAGPVATAGFGTLALVWMLANGIGWRRALQRRLSSHERWMIRSWALTLSAVTLRLYIPLFEVVGLPELPAYRAISILCWLPNLAAAELLLMWKAHATNAHVQN